jgi:hypothetical protein
MSILYLPGIKCLLGHPDHSLVNKQTTQTQLLAFHVGFLKTKGTFNYDNLAHILLNVPLFTSTALHCVLCIKWFPKNEMVYSTHNLHTHAFNNWWTSGGHRILLLNRTIMVVYQQHPIHRTEYRKDTAQKNFTIFSDLNQIKYDLTNPIQWIVLFIAKDCGIFSCLPGLSEDWNISKSNWIKDYYWI